MPADFEALLSKLERRKPERLEKDSETYKIMASVFDSSTLLTLYHMINRGVFDVFYGVVSTGKEANIFCALDKQGNYVATKIYRIATSNFKNMYRYLLEIRDFAVSSANDDRLSTLGLRGSSRICSALTKLASQYLGRSTARKMYWRWSS